LSPIPTKAISTGWELNSLPTSFIELLLPAGFIKLDHEIRLLRLKIRWWIDLFGQRFCFVIRLEPLYSDARVRLMRVLTD
jgi:hypothetical protein